MFHHDLRHTGRSTVDTSKNDGEIKWHFDAGGSVFSSPAIGADGTVYFGASAGLYAVTAGVGKKWLFSAGGQPVSSSPAIGSDGTIYFEADDHNLYAVDPAGVEKWAFAIGLAKTNPAAPYASGPVIGSDGTIYVGSGDGNLYALNPNGTLKWAFATGGSLSSSPAIGGDGTIYVGSRDHDLYAV